VGHAEPVIGPAHRVRPLAGPMAGSGRTRWRCPPSRLIGFIEPISIYYVTETLSLAADTLPLLLPLQEFAEQRLALIR
jgi:hypothetical protein